MACFIFTCGTHTFTNPLPGYENVTAQCQNCGNYSAKCYKRWEWFTLCFIPLVPFSLRPYREVGCHICRFFQELKYRPDVENQGAGVAVGAGGGGGGQYALQNQPGRVPGGGGGDAYASGGGMKNTGPPGGPNQGPVYS